MSAIFFATNSHPFLLTESSAPPPPAWINERFGALVKQPPRLGKLALVPAVRDSDDGAPR
jgi:hypothetical protein